MSSIDIVVPGGRTIKLASAEGVSLRLGVGTKLHLGADVSLTVVDGGLVISGDDAMSDPQIQGAIYVDPATGYLKVSNG